MKYEIAEYMKLLLHEICNYMEQENKKVFLSLIKKCTILQKNPQESAKNKRKTTQYKGKTWENGQDDYKLSLIGKCTKTREKKQENGDISEKWSIF